MQSLYVYYENKKVGKLTRDEEDVYSFEYDEAWQLFPLSLAMPIQEKKIGNKITQSFFANLLPEGDVRRNLEATQGIAGTFEFLEQYGKDCAGAIVISLDPRYSHKPNDLEKKVEINMEEIYRAIRGHQSVVDVIAKMEPGYLSLAGAQDKFSVIFENGKFYLPLRGGATTHIVKTPIHRLNIKESVYNEYYCMELAYNLGFDVPKFEIFRGKEPLYIIERYDRRTDKQGVTHRLHQQDFCQAQGVLNDYKYEIKGGPSIVNNYNLILEHITGHEKFKALERYLDWLCFNLLIGNNDCHSKNISLLSQNKKLSLAPFYDLLCTAVYDKLNSSFAFSIGGRRKYDEISLNQYHQLESDLQLKKNTLINKIQQMHDSVNDLKEITLLDAREEFPEVKIFSRINKVITDRLKNLRRHKIVT